MTVEKSSVRHIGIKHRVKRTADGEARPTQVALLQDGKLTRLDLEDEDAELDFVLCRHPVAFRDATPDDDITAFPPHHVQRKKSGDAERIRVPSAYDGLKAGDVVAVTLGGSGGRLAFALSRRAEAVGATVSWITAGALAMERGDASKDAEAALLANLRNERPELFQTLGPRDRKLIFLREALRAREDAMAARIGCASRLRQQHIGAVFCHEDGLFPEGSIQQDYEHREANDTILNALVVEEKRRERELAKIVESFDVYQELFAPIKGMGPMIAARLIAAIGDVRCFATDAKLKAYCGVHVLPDGSFARRKVGAAANWNQTARQALFLLGDQFNRQKNSEWGLKQREYKVKFRAKHPEPVMETVMVKGKPKTIKKYTDGHIHKMATWRTLTKFVERLHRDWTRLERRNAEATTAAAA